MPSVRSPDDSTFLWESDMPTAMLWCNIGEKAQSVRLFKLRSETQRKDTEGEVAFEKLTARKNEKLQDSKGSAKRR